jgi:hypothetical protein
MRAWNNGIFYNGIVINGRGLNGRGLNGMSLNAINFNDTSLQGAELGRVQLRDGRLVALDTEGAVIEGVDWTGSRVLALLDDEVIDLEIEEVQKASSDGPTMVRLTLDGQSICSDPSAFGMFVPGTWDETGALRPTVEGEPAFDVTFSCPSGVIAKCVTWGYAPWDAGADVHQSCVRMARADYCGDGTSHTRDGTPIDVFDAAGVQQASDDEGFEFEAGWGPDGAVCVSKPRYHDSVVGRGEVLPSCWMDKPACDDFEQARDHGAILANRSYPDSRLLCEAPE